MQRNQIEIHWLNFNPMHYTCRTIYIYIYFKPNLIFMPASLILQRSMGDASKPRSSAGHQKPAARGHTGIDGASGGPHHQHPHRSDERTDRHHLRNSAERILTPTDSVVAKPTTSRPPSPHRKPNTTVTTSSIISPVKRPPSPPYLATPPHQRPTPANSAPLATPTSIPPPHLIPPVPGPLPPHHQTPNSAGGPPPHHQTPNTGHPPPFRGMLDLRVPPPPMMATPTQPIMANIRHPPPGFMSNVCMPMYTYYLINVNIIIIYWY